MVTKITSRQVTKSGGLLIQFESGHKTHLSPEQLKTSILMETPLKVGSEVQIEPTLKPGETEPSKVWANLMS